MMATATKTSLKKWIRTASNFIALTVLFHLVYFIKCWQMFLELNSKGLYQTSGKEKESCCLVFLSLTKSKLRHFHIVVVQWQQRNLQKKSVQSCCFANLNSLLFCCSCCCRRHHYLSSLMFCHHDAIFVQSFVNLTIILLLYMYPFCFLWCR